MPYTQENPVEHNGFTVAADQLRRFIERVERLEEERGAIREDIKSVFDEADSIGFDKKTMRKIIRLRKMDANTRLEEQQILEAYMVALGMQGELPL